MQKCTIVVAYCFLYYPPNLVSYDFHLRYIQRLVQGPNIDLPIDVIRVLRSFVSLNPKKARFARNRVIQGTIATDGLESDSLFRYIIKNANTYHFLPVKYRNDPYALALSCSDPAFTRGMKGLSQSNFLYSLILSEPEDPSSQAFTLDYFIIVVNIAIRFPHRELEEGNFFHQRQIEDPLQDPLEEYINSGYYLKDVAKNFHSMIDDMLNSAKAHLNRDFLWNQVLRDSVPLEDAEEWSRIFLLKFRDSSVDVTNGSPILIPLLKRNDISWPSVLRILSEIKSPYSRIFPSTSKIALALVNPEDSDLIAYFKISDSADLGIYLVEREGKRNPKERQYLTEIVNSIIFILWNTDDY